MPLVKGEVASNFVPFIFLNRSYHTRWCASSVCVLIFTVVASTVRLPVMSWRIITQYREVSNPRFCYVYGSTSTQSSLFHSPVLSGNFGLNKRKQPHYHMSACESLCMVRPLPGIYCDFHMTNYSRSILVYGSTSTRYLL